MAEVTKQMKPLIAEVKELGKWQLGFWSNGSGLEEGFFQRRMKEDDKRNERVISYIDNAEKRQVESEVRQKVKEERWARRLPVIKWMAGILSALVIALAAWLGPQIVKVTRILIDDYLQSHPQVTIKLKNTSENVEPALSSKSETTQDAGGPTGPR